ncbi:MAG: PAS domain S-box protein [Candidatus Marinimicrobia bacterium]|nr:PAS domain S-box protein [Candidatus Neomarinimicrobiota bacterium]
MSYVTKRKFTKKKHLHYTISLTVFLLIINLNAMVDSYLHPQIEYFDHEHLIVGGFTGLVFIFLFGIILYHFNHLESFTLNLQESNDHKQTLFELSPTGLVLCKMSGEIIEVNTAFSKIIGLSVEEILEHNFWDITLDVNDRHDQQIHKSLISAGHYGPYEKEFLHTEGHVVEVSLKGIRLKHQSDEFIWSSVENISEFLQTEKLLKSKIQALEDARNNIKQLKGLLPMCGNCKKIRNEKGEWLSVESFIENHSEAKTTGGICKDCQHELYGSKPWFQKSLQVKKGIL